MTKFNFAKVGFFFEIAKKHFLRKLQLQRNTFKEIL